MKRSTCLVVFAAIAGVGGWIAYSNFDFSPSDLYGLGQPNQPWDLSDFEPWEIVDQQVGPQLSVGSGTSPAAGRRIITFGKRNHRQSLVVHFPYGRYGEANFDKSEAGQISPGDGGYAKKSLPCVLVPSGGSNLLTGTRPTVDRDVMKPYLSKGMVVISYELSGSIHPSDALDPQHFADAYRQFLNVKSGLVNSLNAFDYAVNQIEVVDPNKVFIAGHSSAGTHALLFAAHEPRLAGCVAYCPDPDLADFDATRIKSMKYLPRLTQFVQKASPLTHVEHLQCPVFMFAVQDDPIVAFANIHEYVNRLRQKNMGVIFKWEKTGGHSEAYKKIGLKLGARWIEQISSS